MTKSSSSKTDPREHQRGVGDVAATPAGKV
jgi:hypothetical protein